MAATSNLPLCKEPVRQRSATWSRSHRCQPSAWTHEPQGPGSFGSSGGAAATRQNENYFTNLGGEGAKKREGDVTSVDWTATFSVLEEDVEVLKSPEEKDWAAGTYR